MDIEDLEAVVLAGGLGSRFMERGGGDKLFALIEGKPILLRVVESLERGFSRIIVTTKKDKLEAIKELLGRREKTRVIADEFEERNPLSGMLTGAKEAISDFIFVVSGDAAFIEPSFPATLIELGGMRDAVLPIWPNGKVEPLISVYSRKAILRSSVAIGLKQIRATEPARASSSVAFVPISLLAMMGINPRQLININEPSDMSAEVKRENLGSPEKVAFIEREKNLYLEALESLERGELLTASRIFAEEALQLSKPRTNSLSLHALLDSLFFLDVSQNLNPSVLERRRTSQPF
ncbi:MAG: molybdenum cofactor guanylyltransferase [Fervidicoccaceae archaeon]